MSKTKLCSVEDCKRAHHSYKTHDGLRIGLCTSHLSRIHRSGCLGSKPVRELHSRPKGVNHCQVTGCLGMLKPGSLQTDNGRMWVCSKHRSRYDKYQRFHA